MNNATITKGLMALVLTAGIASAAEKSAPSAPAMSAEQTAMMQKAMPLMTPGAEHRALDPIIGKWNAMVTMWMKPGDKPQQSKGVSDHSWVLNGHFVKQDYKGDMGGQPFEGTGYTGFDKVRNEYQSVWMDSMATGMMVSAGAPASGGTIQQSGTFGCPMTGDKNMWMRTELKIVNNDRFTYASYTKDPQGKEFKGMEIVYTRAK
jgi:hypothetical protein